MPILAHVLYDDEDLDLHLDYEVRCKDP